MEDIPPGELPFSLSSINAEMVHLQHPCTANGLIVLQ
jgi:hypothetical protein